MKKTIFLLISGLFLFLWGSAHAVSLADITSTAFGGSDVVTVPYTITGVDPGNVEGSLTGTVTFKKGDKSQDVLLKIKDDLKLDKDKKIIFSVGELPESVTLGGNNKSISITIVDVTKNKKPPYITLNGGTNKSVDSERSYGFGIDLTPYTKWYAFLPSFKCEGNLEGGRVRISPSADGSGGMGTFNAPKNDTGKNQTCTISVNGADVGGKKVPTATLDIQVKPAKPSTTSSATKKKAAEAAAKKNACTTTFERKEVSTSYMQGVIQNSYQERELLVDISFKSLQEQLVVYKKMVAVFQGHIEGKGGHIANDSGNKAKAQNNKAASVWNLNKVKELINKCKTDSDKPVINKALVAKDYSFRFNVNAADKDLTEEIVIAKKGSIKITNLNKSSNERVRKDTVSTKGGSFIYKPKGMKAFVAWATKKNTAMRFVKYNVVLGDNTAIEKFNYKATHVETGKPIEGVITVTVNLSDKPATKEKVDKKPSAGPRLEVDKETVDSGGEFKVTHQGFSSGLTLSGAAECKGGVQISRSNPLGDSVEGLGKTETWNVSYHQSDSDQECTITYTGESSKSLIEILISGFGDLFGPRDKKETAKKETASVTANVKPISKLKIKATPAVDKDGADFYKIEIESSGGPGSNSWKSECPQGIGEGSFNDGGHDSQLLTLREWIPPVNNTASSIECTISVVHSPSAQVSMSIGGTTYERPQQTASVKVNVIEDDELPPSVSIAEKDVEKKENEGPFTFTAKLDAKVKSSTKITWTVTSLSDQGTPAEDNDFVATQGTVTIPENKTEQQFEIEVVNDNTVEGNERFHVTLTAPAGMKVFNNTATGTIKNDDYYADADSDGWSNEVDCNDADTSVYPGAPEICGDGIDQNCDGIVDEGCAQLCTTDDDCSGAKVCQSGACKDINDSAKICDADGIDNNGNSYIDEPGESCTSSSTTTKQKDDLPSLSIAAGEAKESEGTISFIVELDEPVLSNNISYSYTVAAGAGDNSASVNDFADGAFPIKVMRTLGAGKKRDEVKIALADDDLFEEDETFTVTLSLTDATKATKSVKLGNASAIGTIKDDVVDYCAEKPNYCGNNGTCKNDPDEKDGLLCQCATGYSGTTCDTESASLSAVITSPSQVDSGKNLHVSAESSYGGSGQELSYSWSASCDGGLKEYIFDSTTAVIALWTAPKNTTENIQNCTLSVKVTDPVNGASATDSVKIGVKPAKPDTKPLQVSLATKDGNKQSVDEGIFQEGRGFTGTLSFTVSLSQAASKKLNIPYTVTGIKGKDFKANLKVLTFEKDEQFKDIVLTVSNDIVLEKDATIVTVKLGDASGVNLGEKKTATGTIYALGDLDGDGYAIFTGDCDEGDPSVYPDASEYCDDIDNNCDGQVDEGLKDCPTSAKQKESKPLQIEFNNEEITKAEGDEYVFTVRLVGGSVKNDVKARYTVEGTGTNPADKDDFVDGKLPEDTLTIPAGEEGNAITIKVKGDTDKEKTEEFTITLSNPSPGVEIVENGKSSKGIIQDGNGVGSSSQSFITQNACDANPCQNSGACSDLENGYRCDCPLGFSGDVCQIEGSSIGADKPKKEFKLVAGSRTVLLINSILRDGRSLTTPESVVTSFEEARRTTTTTTTPTTTPAAPPEICGNFVDDDLDGLVDFADVADCTATADETAFCFDGLDNDNDGLPDIFDSDCIPEICGNFVDDDGDGDTDFADAECTATADETAFCFDGLDNDNDGDVDGADSDCATSTPLTLVLPLLNDIDGDDIVIVVDGGDNLSTVRSTDADLVTNSLFLVQFTGFGMAIAVPRTGVTANGAVTLFDGPNPLEFTRGATIYEINIGVTITSPTDITVDALSGNNCGAGPC